MLFVGCNKLGSNALKVSVCLFLRLSPGTTPWQVCSLNHEHAFSFFRGLMEDTPQFVLSHLTPWKSPMPATLIPWL